MANKEDNSKFSSMIMVMITFLSAVILVAFISDKSVYDRYTTAQIDVANGNYENAVEILDDMTFLENNWKSKYKGYSELSREAHNCLNIENAHSLEKEGKYEEAIDLLQDIEASSDLEISDKMNRIADVQYEWGISLYDEGEYIKAFNVLYTLPYDYESDDDKKYHYVLAILQSRNMVADWAYNEAAEAFLADDFDKAYEIFEALDGYKDSDKICRYIDGMER